jgi:hypothetical protein
LGVDQIFDSSACLIEVVAVERRHVPCTVLFTVPWTVLWTVLWTVFLFTVWHRVLWQLLRLTACEDPCMHSLHAVKTDILYMHLIVESDYNIIPACMHVFFDISLCA